MSVTLIDLQREQMAHADTKARLEAAMAENTTTRGALAKLQSENANMQTQSKRAIVDPKGDAVKIAVLTAERDKLRRELDAKG